MSKLPLSRRTLLRGLAGGVSAALPLPPLEAMLDGHGTAYADGSPIPRKLLVWFFGNGVHSYYGPSNHVERWAPPDTGPSWTPSELLKPLAADPAIKNYVNVVTGMNSKCNAYAHNGAMAVLAGSPGALVDGTLCKNSTSGTVCSSLGKTIDQITAASVGTGTRFKSLELSCDFWYPSDGTAVVLSQNGRGSVNFPERDPRKVFSRVFGVQAATGTRDPALGARRSILDAVIDDAASLDAALGVADRRRVAEYLENVRSLERRLALPGVACQGPASVGGVAQTDLDGPSFTKLNQAWSELIAIALACDLTRVITYQFTRPGSFTRFKEIGVGQMHALAHNEPAPQSQHHKGITFTLQKLAESVNVFYKTRIGAGNLLDSLCMLTTSELSRGWDHDQRSYPVLFIGKAGGALRHPGIHWRRAGDDYDRIGFKGTSQVTADKQGAPGDYRDTADDNLSRVPLTALWAMGVKKETFGYDRGLVSSPLTDLLTGL